ncbi:hypothetical protein JN531_012550 [Flagellatimonas centrodinii]|uniref:hypothetical protein n=1 Tax=Flagellatimonas centrodinii TaxID=2806210 RepID=UPI001FEFBB9D|nr:hypothetical protein [Flagellatimonas centrodinii]ULQ45929.1 hypothetical protein JN531_012550 [Flagellatimonas centrodinii]
MNPDLLPIATRIGAGVTIVHLVPDGTHRSLCQVDCLYGTPAKEVARAEACERCFLLAELQGLPRPAFADQSRRTEGSHGLGLQHPEGPTDV